MDIFGYQEGLDLLEEEIKTFNGLNPVIKPYWISFIENRKTKMRASAIVSFETKEEADRAIRNRLYIAGTSMRVVKYIPTKSIQYKRCQDFDHSEYDCYKDYKYSICDKNHSIRLHLCVTCKKKGEICEHTKIECVNCQKDYQATNKICEKFQALQGKKLNKPEIFSHVEI